MPVCSTEEMDIRCQKISVTHPGFKKFLQQVIAQDPRPAYRKHNDDDKIYGVRLLTFNINWQVQNGIATICAITDIG